MFPEQVLMATNRPDTLDPALLRPGRLDRKVEFGLPDLESRTQIFQIHTRTMNCERDIRFELLSRCVAQCAFAVVAGSEWSSVCVCPILLAHMLHSHGMFVLASVAQGVCCRC